MTEEARDGETRAARIERVLASVLAWRFAPAAYLVGTLLAGAVWWLTSPRSSPWFYFLPQFTVNYADNGFTRRALPGTIADVFGVEPSVTAVKVLYAAGVIAALITLLGLAWHATRTLRPLQRAAVLALLSLSPAAVLHWVKDLGRLDAWVVCLAAVATILANRRAYLSAALAAATAGLIHESAFIVFGFLALAVADDRRRQGAVTQGEAVRAGAALLGLGVLFAYLLLYGSADLASLQQSAARIGERVEIDGSSLYYSYLSFDSHPVAWTSCFMRNDPARAADLILTLGYLSLQALALFAWSDRLRMGLAQLALVGTVIMGFVALDIGRYAAFASAALWLYFFLALQTERPSQVFRKKSFYALAALTALGPLGVTDGIESLKGVLDGLLGAHELGDVGTICNAEIRALSHDDGL